MIIILQQLLIVKVDFLKRGQASPQPFDSDHLAKIFKTNFTGQILETGQVRY